ncbi:MAG: cytochrome ubiquinol oxidase subunit I [Proteobacteria bacterium]|nr:cytochrome ubiquinol oxidase subunit I [Pseudomonadota bacterium]
MAEGGSWPKALAGVRGGILKISLILVVVYLLAFLLPRAFEAADYRHFPVIGSRVLVWSVAQAHLMFAAFVLGVPIFVFIAEVVGVFLKSEEYDGLAKEFMRLLAMSYTITATLGGILLVALITLYPKFTTHMEKVFEPTWAFYIGVIFSEALFSYLYFYSWDLMQGSRKKWHLLLGGVVNAVGIGILVITNAWTGYMMTPGGVEGSDLAITVTSRIDAFMNYAWNPLNIHRLLANVCFGGAIVGAYAGFRFLASTSDEERARFDWMGYIGSFIAVAAFIPLPFAGYYLGREIYAYSQQMGVSMMGGSFAQLWILQAILIGALFLAINLYLWLAMARIPGGERYKKFQAPVLFVLATGLAVWATPHSIIATVAEMKAMGSAHHPRLGVLGVMSAKNTAVNLMILSTFITFMLYRRGNKKATGSFVVAGNSIQIVALLAALGGIVAIGVYGYFVPAAVRVGLSAYQPMMVGAFMIVFLLLEVPIYRGATSLGEIKWGQIPRLSQYVLFFLAVTFTWLMGLMGYIRSGIRQYWHVYQVMKDTSEGAFIPSHGFATTVISIIVLIFFLFVSMVFALAMRSELQDRDPP